MTQSRMDRTPTAERAKKDLTFEEKIQQKAKSDEELLEIRDSFWKRWYDNPSKENTKLLDDFDHTKRVLLPDVLRLYAEDQKERKQKLRDFLKWLQDTEWRGVSSEVLDEFKEKFDELLNEEKG